LQPIVAAPGNGAAPEFDSELGAQHVERQQPHAAPPGAAATGCAMSDPKPRKVCSSLALPNGTRCDLSF
jgi:hypothetical protein